MMTQAQADTMLTYLWANNIAAKRLKAEGYSDKNPVGDNALIHGSAYNRRVEIEWQIVPRSCPQKVAFVPMPTK